MDSVLEEYERIIHLKRYGKIYLPHVETKVERTVFLVRANTYAHPIQLYDLKSQYLVCHPENYSPSCCNRH